MKKTGMQLIALVEGYLSLIHISLEKFSGVPQELGLPSAPKQFIRYC